MSVIDDIKTERERQIAKGYDSAHDDAHDRDELRMAAASYILRASRHGDTPIFASLGRRPLTAQANFGWVGIGGMLWPFTDEFPYDTNPRQRLIASAALLVAEIERLDRIALASKEGQ